MSPLTPEKALIFRITHIKNVEWLLANGLHCRNSKVLDGDYQETGNPDLIAKRADRLVDTPPGGTLSDYIPFYFTPYSPMMLNIKTGYNGMKQTPISDIVILVSSLHKIKEMGIEFVFSDCHAYLQVARFSNDLGELGRIDWKILQARDFKRDPNDLGKMERYQAEALIHHHLPIGALLGIICYGEPQRQQVADLAQKHGVTLEVKAIPGWYL
jgi:hypothetical protein